MFVYPGLDVTSHVLDSSTSGNTKTTTTLGTGLLQNRRNGKIHTTCPGYLRESLLQTKSTGNGASGTVEKRVWVGATRKRNGRYVPGTNDVVVGTIIESLGDRYTVDIGAGRLAVLDALAFDGASKRNAPELELQSIVFARVLSGGLMDASEPVLSCQAPNLGSNDSKKDWTTGEATFGELRGNGSIVEVSFRTSRGLAANTEQPKLLEALSRVGPFELCVGLNGRVFIDAKDERIVILVANALKAAEGKEEMDGKSSGVFVQEIARELGLSLGKQQGNGNNRPDSMTERASKRNKGSKKDGSDEDEDMEIEDESD